MNVQLSGLLKQARETERNISVYMCMCACACVCVLVHMGWTERGGSEDSS